MKKLWIILFLFAACTQGQMKAQPITVFHNNTTYAISKVIRHNGCVCPPCCDNETSFYYVATCGGQIVFKDINREMLVNTIFGYGGCVCEPCCDNPYQITVYTTAGEKVTWKGWLFQAEGKVSNIESITISQ